MKKSLTVGLMFLDSFPLADSFVVSWWVKKKSVGSCGIGEGSQKWSCDNCLCFCWSEGAGAPRYTNVN